jgi:pimeloyl-ACP methyl ester carboxylesterase
MLFARAAARSFGGLRAFSTARVYRAELSYQVYGPETEKATRDPILFLHGLFGSKQNNRSISKYVSTITIRVTTILICGAEL